VRWRQARSSKLPEVQDRLEGKLIPQPGSIGFPGRLRQQVAKDSGWLTRVRSVAFLPNPAGVARGDPLASPRVTFTVRVLDAALRVLRRTAAPRSLTDVLTPWYS
jgi:hypothetical protein